VPEYIVKWLLQSSRKKWAPRTLLPPYCSNVSVASKMYLAVDKNKGRFSSFVYRLSRAAAWTAPSAALRSPLVRLFAPLTVCFTHAASAAPFVGRVWQIQRKVSILMNRRTSFARNATPGRP